MEAGPLHGTIYFRLLAVPFQSVEGASESRKQARRDWSERTSRGETGGAPSAPLAARSARLARSLGSLGSLARITFARSVDHRLRVCSPARLSREGLLAVYIYFS